MSVHDRADALAALICAENGLDPAELQSRIAATVSEYAQMALPTDELALALEGLDVLAAGDEPDESSTLAAGYNRLWEELEARGALTDGGTTPSSGRPHKGLLIFEAAELANLFALLRELRVRGGELVAPAGGIDVAGLGDTIAAVQIELDRVLSGLWHGFPPPAGHPHPDTDEVLGRRRAA